MKRFFACVIIVILFHGTLVMAEEAMWFSTGAGAMSGAINVAEAKDFFLEQNINGKAKRFNKGKIAFDNYLSGQVDFAATNVISVVLTDFDLSKHRLIGTLAYTDNQTKVLVRKSAGIASPADLRGKKIATPFATTGHFYLYKLLALNDIPASDVEIVFMNKKQLARAIVKGQVDAICQHGMPIENAKKALKDDWLIFQEKSIHRKPVSLIAPKKWLFEQPEQAKGILKAILKADKFIQTNTDESIRILAKAKGYPFEEMREAVCDEIDFNLSLNQDLYKSLKETEQWAIDNRLVRRRKPRDYRKLIDYRPLKSVAPEKVTIIR